METIEKKAKIPGWLSLTLLIGEVALMLFLVTISIITMATVGNAQGIIKWFQLNPIWMFVIVVFPLIVLFLFNVYLLIKTLNSQKEKSFDPSGMTQEELLEEARKQAREELMKEMEKNKDSKQ
ncbi:MAG: hypothetical protein AB7D50_02170 [Bacilli bacterium]